MKPTYCHLSSLRSCDRVTVLASRQQPVIQSRASRGYCWSRKYRGTYAYLPNLPKTIEYRGGTYETWSKELPSDGYWWNGDLFRRRSLSGQNWRLLSSWGRRAGSDALKDDFPELSGKTKDDSLDGWAETYKKFQRDMDEEFELFKQKIHEDPYRALFGRRLSGRFSLPMYGALRKADETSERRDERSFHGSVKYASDGNIASKETENGTRVPHGSFTSQHLSGGKDGTVEDFKIDPITMRKVPKNSTPSCLHPVQSTAVSFNIPVKRSRAARPTSRDAKTQQESFNDRSTETLTKTEIVRQGAEPRSETALPDSGIFDSCPQEGLGHNIHQNAVNHRAKPLDNDTGRKSPLPKIETALDRKISQEASENGRNRGPSYLKYHTKEVKADDVDLLRASDIRAASNARSALMAQTEKQKQERRRRLEADFKMHLQEREKHMQDALAIRRQQRHEKENKKRTKAAAAHVKEVETQKAAMEALETDKVACFKAPKTLSDSICQPGEGDMATNVHEFASRDRWYKLKAPHAAGNVEKRAMQVAKDRSLVREIRGIYEDTYGIIDTKHRQPTPATTLERKEGNLVPSKHNLTPRRVEYATACGTNSEFDMLQADMKAVTESARNIQELNLGASARPSPTSQSEPKTRNEESDANWNKSIPLCQASGDLAAQTAPRVVYSILAYDSSSREVTKATMSPLMESPTEKILSLSEALSSLSEPTKFLPHLTSLQSEGFEIVSSEPNVLILRKVKQAAPVAKQAAIKEENRKSINPIDGTTTTGNFASPTGFVNHDTVLPPSAFESQDSVPRSNKVRRNEDVFSGASRSHWHEKRSSHFRDKARRKGKWRLAARRRRWAKYVLLWGIGAMGYVYALGVVIEDMRG
ncbi:MAG: hypothetical protein Q9190_001463 [Brigantiaea leucoxantha]